MFYLPANCMSITRTGFVGHGVNRVNTNTARCRWFMFNKLKPLKPLESRYSFTPMQTVQTSRPKIVSLAHTQFAHIQLSSALRRLWSIASIANGSGIRVSRVSRVSALNRFGFCRNCVCVSVSRSSVTRVTVSSATGSVCNSNSFQKTQLLKKYISGKNPYLLVNTFSSLSCNKMLENKPFERLNKSVVPKHYALELKPNLSLLTFEGKTSVKIEVAVATDTITLHALDLVIKSASLVDSTGNVLIPTVTYSIEDETASFKFPQNLSLGQSALDLEFTGELNDKMKGFYRSKYIGPDGKERFAAVTQFEATDARRCFPCWDEPAIKATFDITLVVPENRVALSNMTIKEETTQNGFRTIHFNTTPIMSTYLVAVVVGEYDYIEDVSHDGVTVRVYTPVGKKEQGRFALEVATKVLPYYKDYFKIAYPLPKIDLIAISDFSAGAMENWGLVTYRETAILIDPENSSAVSKQWVALVVGHELAHQWFGNLVTMEWWSDLWLNEGYASFVEFLCVNHIFPEYDIWTQFVTDTLIRALELDCLESSHAIEVPVGHPSEVDEIFDEISYNKGASVIRMLHKYIGDDDFRKGMNLYLTRHQYANTITTDLWSALEEASGKPVGAVMSTWTKQMGFPVVSVEKSEEGNSRILTLKQEKFCASGCKDSAETQWIVPISISTSKKPEEVALTTVLDKKSTVVRIDNVSKNQWVKVNPGTVGYYRVQYPPEMLAEFEPAIRDLSMPPLDRLGLLDDLFAMVKAGHSPTVQVLKLLEAFTQETNYTVWASISNCFSKLSDLISHTDLQPQFDKYARKLFTPIANRLGWDPKPNESHLDTLLRSLVLNKMVAYDDPETIKEATRRFTLHVNEKAPLLADLRNVCYRAVLKNSDEAMLNKVLDLYRTVDLHEEKVRILRSLGVMKDNILLEKVLQFGISNEVRAQDIVFCVIPVSMNPAGRELAWQFFKDNSKMFLERYQGGFLIAQLVRFSTQNFATEIKAKEIEDFFKGSPIPGTERTVQQSVETIRLTESWLNRDLPGITEFLNVSYKD